MLLGAEGTRNNQTGRQREIERKSECLCVRERERGRENKRQKVCVCVGEREVDRDRDIIEKKEGQKGERRQQERERESERQKVCVCVRVCA